MKGTTGSTYVVDASGGLWAWGQNVFGNLGHNNQTQYSSPKQVGGSTWTTLSHNTYAHIVQGRKSDGTLWFWGTNGSGALPSPSTYYSSPTQLGTATNWSLGKHDVSNTCCGGIRDGDLYLWGGNTNGTLGDNSTTSAPGNTTKQVPGTWKNMRLAWNTCIATKE